MENITIVCNYGGKPIDLEFRIFRYKTCRGEKD